MQPLASLTRIAATPAPRAAANAAPQLAVIIPARNESATIGGVVDAARGSRLVDEVIVVDNGSSDRTAAVAAEHGARVLTQSLPGKGEAMATGVAATSAPYVTFFDADLRGLTSAHVDALAAPVLDGAADMTRGMLDRGAVKNAMHRYVLPNFSGQRTMRRELFESLELADVHGWKTEAALNANAAAQGARVRDLVLDGLSHRKKQEKYASPVAGLQSKATMLGTAAWAQASFRIAHALGHGATRPLASFPLRGEPYAPAS